MRREAAASFEPASEAMLAGKRDWGSHALESPDYRTCGSFKPSQAIIRIRLNLTIRDRTDLAHK